MSEHAETEHHVNYVKVWALLVVLLAISVMGPMIGIKWVTLVTLAPGIPWVSFQGSTGMKTGGRPVEGNSETV